MTAWYVRTDVAHHASVIVKMPLLRRIQARMTRRQNNLCTTDDDGKSTIGKTDRTGRGVKPETCIPNTQCHVGTPLNVLRTALQQHHQSGSHAIRCTLNVHTTKAQKVEFRCKH